MVINNSRTAKAIAQAMGVPIVTGPQYKFRQQLARERGFEPNATREQLLDGFGWTDQGARYIPTEEEIAAATAKIREGWSEREMESRLSGSDRPVPADVLRQPSGYKHNGYDVVT